MPQREPHCSTTALRSPVTLHLHGEKLAAAIQVADAAHPSAPSCTQMRATNGEPALPRRLLAKAELAQGKVGFRLLLAQPELPYMQEASTGNVQRASGDQHQRHASATVVALESCSVGAARLAGGAP